MIFSRLVTGAILAGSVMFCGAAFAQEAAPETQQLQAGQPATPTDVKPIGDWTVRCFPVASPSPCDMYEELDDKNTRQRVIGVSIAYMPEGDRHVAQIAVPLGVSIPAGTVIKADSYTSAKLPYRRCDRAGCYVEMILPADMMAALGRSGPEATINIVSDDGKPFALRFSLNGFSGAHDAMATLARAKATKGAAKP